VASLQQQQQQQQQQPWLLLLLLFRATAQALWTVEPQLLLGCQAQWLLLS
jgi:hypothetical protein